MASQSVDLSKVFTAVTKELKANQASLNEADVYNHDHGSNMVDVFRTVTKAVKSKKDAPASEQLAYASMLLQKKPSGSAKAYSQNLAEAATRFEGRSVTPDSAMQLITALMGSQQAQAPAASQDPFGGLAGSALSGMLGGQQQAQPASAGQDPLVGMVGSLLGGLMGGGAASAPATQQNQSQPGFDMGDLLQAGQVFMQAQQKGSSPMEALMAALMSGSSLGDSPHRKESGSLIVNTILKVIGSMAKK